MLRLLLAPLQGAMRPRGRDTFTTCLALAVSCFVALLLVTDGRAPLWLAAIAGLAAWLLSDCGIRHHAKRDD
jgi:type IV secretory pathway TrbD component